MSWQRLDDPFASFCQIFHFTIFSTNHFENLSRTHRFETMEFSNFLHFSLAYNFFRGWTLSESELFSSVKYSCASSKVSSALLPKSPPILAFLLKDRGYPYRSFRNRCWRFVKFEALFRKYFEQQLRKRRKFLEYTKRVEY